MQNHWRSEAPLIVRGSTYRAADAQRPDEGPVDDQIYFTLVGRR
jgi:hypothetical protein